MAFRDAIIVDKLFVLKDNIVLTTKHTGSKITNTKRSIIVADSSNKKIKFKMIR